MSAPLSIVCFVLSLYFSLVLVQLAVVFPTHRHSFAVHLQDRPEHECLSRFIAKFIEAGMEKVDRVMDLYMEYTEK